ncbi:MAG: peptide chain release factor N(5)-glutamine methyltransferase [Bacteroidetes bacterium]|nr:peptide chain release factor N(5)-glutamine methyltransferase [Bacteroidota bacterium]
MTVKELYRFFLHELSNTSFREDATAISSIIFEEVAGIDKKHLIQNPGAILPEDVVERIQHCLSELKNNKPVQYITGYCWFYNMKLRVNPNVLIPRPETEELAKAVIEYASKKQRSAILDIGTGSGCIAIAIKKNVPGATVTAIDISKEALETAAANALAENASIQLLQTDILSPISRQQLDVYDVIVSNPPYIPLQESATMDKNVTAYEPHLALFVDNNKPLVFYEAICAFAEEHLKNDGVVFLETHEQLAGSVAKLFSHHYESHVIKDMFGKERMVMAIRCR